MSSVENVVARSVVSPVARAVGAGIGGGLTLSQVVADAVGYWQLQDDAASTAVVDSSAGSNNGTLVGGVNTADISTTGPNASYAKSLDFNGTNQYVGSIGTGTTVQHIHQTAICTLSGWVKLDAINARYYWLGNSLGAATDNGFFFGFEYGIGLGDNALRLAIKKSGGYVVDARSPNSAIVDTDWHHVAAVSNAASGVTFYVDGVALGAPTYITAFTSVTTGGATRLLRIGATNHTSLTLPFAGAMAGVGIWDRVLTDTEISVLAG